MKNKEVWKDIKGWEGFYQISNLGRSRSLDRFVRYPAGAMRFYKGKMMKNTIRNGRYQIIMMSNSKVERKTAYVHVLVAKAFLDNNYLKKGLTVNHINGIKTDNRLENLELLTIGDNIRHAHLSGLISLGQERSCSKFRNKDIIKIRKMRDEGSTYREIANKYNVATNAIKQIVIRKTWKHI